MGLRERLADILAPRERKLAGDAAVIVATGIAAILESLADEAALDTVWSSSASIIAATYRDAADRAATVGIEVAETIRR